jgi:hypothetical protein
MNEKDLETGLCRRLDDGQADRQLLSNLRLRHSTGDATTLRDLVGDFPYKIIKDDSLWNLDPKLMIEVIGGMTPDIVLRSQVSGENRIYIEVKKSAELNYCRADSQVVRYFLHLLATTRSNPKRDIRRSLILAAPSSWFEVPANADKWEYFLRTYAPLAFSFDVTLGEIRLDEQ